MFKSPDDQNFRGVADFPGLVDFKEYTASGTYTWIPPMCPWDMLYLELIGGGGSGACRLTTGNAAGGGGGEFVNGWLAAATAILGGFALTVGGGGAAHVSGNGDGFDGNPSIAFGMMNANGGHGGQHAAAAAAAPAGTAGDFVGMGTPLNGGSSSARGIYAGAGGGVTAGNVSIIGGSSRHGGGGGGSISDSVLRAGGASTFAGSGGTSGTGAIPIVDATAPGGGGGAGRNGQPSGRGRDGRIRIWCYQAAYQWDRGFSQ